MKSNRLLKTSFCLTIAVSLLSCDSVPTSTAAVAAAVDTTKNPEAVAAQPPVQETAAATLDTALFNQQLVHMTNGDSSGKWPVKTAYPLPGAILPYKRIIAYYGNLYSTRMGILGELPPKQMIEKLKTELKSWEAADPATPVQPALHYICVTAQGSPGAAGKYRLRMPFKQIDSVLSIAKMIDAIVFLDIQVGLGSLQEEIPELEKYLAMPNVHLGIDPEFSMKGGQAPGKVIGSFDAADINYASDYLAKLVKKHNLPPKVLVVHRFTRPMVKNYQQISTRPEVQIVMHMDGWGAPARKIGTYKHFIYTEPIEFTGFKIFYKNDLKETPSRLLTPEELMKLKPRPLYIQYQ
ncbi:hypothetical protein [Flavihumibacter sp. CACIAM 22H1]|uniref:hypothetical protein n=1 Tax=Flavihumibacter sp. CACIAM 22H1 TaxID=1812911 RepID=UPI0007A80C37|nr:hypothetical protein [Flavihumibacter sp. CACIAM 22H1]KYP13384.1 MAG: hypothetical protein A1D16_20940 [Flavihumibacter sp. CACIAM 22H1]